MTKAPISLQDLRRRMYWKAKSAKSINGDGVTNCFVKVAATRHDP
jgi:hypothetical protein